MKKRPGSLWPLGLILLLCPFGLLAETSAPSAGAALTAADVEAFLEGVVPNQIAREDIAGAVVVVVKDGKVLFGKGYGFADVEKRTPVSLDDTLFRPGSTSKLFTWTAVMQLVEQGKLDLDRDVNAYLDFKVPEAFGKPITLRDIMTHTPGYEDYVKELFVTDPSRIQPLGQHVSDAPAAARSSRRGRRARTPTTRPRSRATSSSASPASPSRSTSRRTSPVRSG